MTRNQPGAEAFGGVDPAGIADVDVLGLLAVQCTTVLDADLSRVMLVSPTGSMCTAARSGDPSLLAGLRDPQPDECGPYEECVASDRPVIETDLVVHADRWPTFGRRVRDVGILAVHVLPLRAGGATIGAVGLLAGRTPVLDDHDAQVGQALADSAAIGFVSQHCSRNARMVVEQLQTALNSRVVIEQAKGVLAERSGLDVEQAFDALRRHARHDRRRLSDLASQVVAGTIDARAIVEPLGGAPAGERDPVRHRRRVDRGPYPPGGVAGRPVK